MDKTEWQATISLACIFGVRMLGLFMILPVFALYAESLQNVTPLLMGLAISVYGLTQALLQIPFGMLSDHFGRKPIIILGLCLFITGSIVAATATTIEMVIVGRALQGCGAIASVVMALLADLTTDKHRTKAMAVVGMSIGVSFILALILGPLFDQMIGVAGIFWLTAVLASVAIVIVLLLVPQPQQSSFHNDTQAEPAKLSLVLSNKRLLQLDLGIFVLHMILTASFVVLPLILRDQLSLSNLQHSYLYLSVLGASGIIMLPILILSEKYQRQRQAFLGAIIALGSAEVLLYFMTGSLVGLLFALVIFFSAFNLLEAKLPSLISKLSPKASKGTAMGVYSSSQFFGIFLGGLIGGWLYGEFGAVSIFVFSLMMISIWLLLTWDMVFPSYQ